MIGSGAVVASLMVVLEQLGDLVARIVQLQTTLNDERAAAATTAGAAATTLVGGQGQDESTRLLRCSKDLLESRLRKRRLHWWTLDTSYV